MRYRNTIVLLALVLGFVTSWAQTGVTFKVIDNDGNEIAYEITSDNTVMYKAGPDFWSREKYIHIVVPEDIVYQGKTYKVTELAPGCFSFYTSLKEVVLPNSVTTLPAKKGNDGDYTGTFHGCYQLRNVVLPGNLKEIGPYSFHNCQEIKHISIPNHVEIIGDFAFDYCGSLEDIKLPQGLKHIGNCAFSYCKSLVQMVFPKGLESLGGGCLAYCTNLKTVIWPDNIQSLNTYNPNSDYSHEGFFRECTNLENMELPTELTTIGPACFYGCKNLKRIVIPDGVQSLPSSSWYYQGETVYYGTFEDCNSLEEIVLSKSLSLIDRNCFRGCTNLQRVIGLNSSILLPCASGKNYTGYGYTTIYRDPFEASAFKTKMDSVRHTFSYTAEPKIRSSIVEWQKKKDYETTEQWHSRVTESSRKAKVEELLELQRQEYITNNTPKKFSGTIGNYDADYNAFPVRVSGMNMIFVKVPSSIAAEFKEKWDKISSKATPVYGIIDNNLGVLSCVFKYKGQEYGLAQTFQNDDAGSLGLNLSPLELNLSGKENKAVAAFTQVDNSLDLNIPTVTQSNTKTFAIIIGNEKYTKVAEVPYAENDAKVFAAYCRKTLGIPVQNIRKYDNATFGSMLSAMADIKNIAEAYEGDLNVIFYYAGHGVPNESTKDAFLLPVDVDGQQTEACYPVSRLYKELGELGAKNVVVFMDACFSGAQRGSGMLASARGVALKVKSVAPNGNMVVFSAAQGDETAYPYKEKGHGLFTYFLLKKLQESKGECTLGELGEYIQSNVKQQAVVVNRKSQTPTIVPSAGISANWRSLKLK